MGDLYQLKKAVDRLIAQLEVDLESNTSAAKNKQGGRWELDPSIFDYLGIAPPKRMAPKIEKQISPLRQEKLNNKNLLAEQLKEEPKQSMFSNIKQMFSKPSMDERQIVEE